MTDFRHDCSVAPAYDNPLIGHACPEMSGPPCIVLKKRIVLPVRADFTKEITVALITQDRPAHR